MPVRPRERTSFAGEGRAVGLRWLALVAVLALLAAGFAIGRRAEREDRRTRDADAALGRAIRETFDPAR